MLNLFQATAYLHRNNIGHRDLRPDNIMITSTEDVELNLEQIIVRIIDFNVAVEVDDDQTKIKGATSLREWSAPETRKSSEHNFMKIDSWTLGCVMHFICTGE